MALIRPGDWIKNGFLVMPLFFEPALLSVSAALAVALGFAVFSAAASAVYVFNDYADRESDALHERKRHRPLASGAVSPAQGLAIGIVLLALVAVGAANLPARFAVIVTLYLLLNAAYSAGLKKISLLDVLIIAAGFVLRLLAGAAIIGVVPSDWILLSTGLLALFLALGKRRDDLVRELGSDHRASLAGYNRQFLDVSIAVVLGALLVAYIMYTRDPQVTARLGTANMIYTTPFVVLGILRYLQITLVEERSGSPTALLLTDRMIQAVVAGWLCACALLIY